ncbi:MAG: nitrate reductase molybdenum cofactor assembly chaperone [Burkholderiales bacterium]|jgi:nitrate reductase delta subunit|nr:nitrate reductase molybdenum cofactor assembly chaperone [Burkholderiales bacterium]
MTITLKALGALLTYPTPALRQALPEVVAALEAEGLVGRKARAAVKALADEIAAGEPLETEERYVSLFDRGRRTSLHLFEHVHGDSRDRGQAMVDLRTVYERAGFHLAANELPDYLPAVLEYLSYRPLAEAREMLVDCAHIVRALGETLAERDSRYAAVFAALLEIAGEPGLKPGRSGVPVEEDKPLDEEWAEEPVVFGPAAAPSACGTHASFLSKGPVQGARR